MSLSTAQSEALKWLREHNGTGVFCPRGQVLTAAGEVAPHTRLTWNKLRDAGHLTISGKRITVLP
jgi:hypothetical protein